ncbi:MAG: outer membrane beta-barrel protein [Acidobacteriota bacterium]|nr:outer membrane beta-barrel protein [Acidobacteriota bacterium]
MLIVAAVTAATASPAGAQTSSDPVATAKAHLGPLAMTPRVTVSNLGVDTNVFNTVDNPQQDFTVTMTPSTQVWMHLGRALLSGNFGTGIVYYRKFKSQRGIETTDSLRLDLPLNRLRTYAMDSYANARQRPNSEIDARARYTTNTVTAGVDLVLLGQMSVGAYGRLDETRYARGELFYGADLGQLLNRRGNTVGVRIRDPLTPFTTITLSGEASQDRFASSPERNSDSTTGSFGIEFTPQALISGAASVGYQRFRPLGPGVPGYRGVTASVGLNYVLLGVTKFGVQVNRNVQYSFDVNAPYYVDTGVTVSIAQRLFGPVDLLARAANEQLAYRNLTVGSTSPLGRVDTVRTYGGGIGYRLGNDFTVGVNANLVRRISAVDLRRYQGLQVGMNVTYGGS